MNLYPTLPMQAAQPQPGSSLSFYAMMIGIMLIWWFLYFRPRDQREKSHEEALKAAKKGDLVVTSGGLHGKVVAVADDLFSIEVGTVKGGGAVRVQVSKNRIESVMSPEQALAAKNKDADDSKGEKSGKDQGAKKGGS